MLKEFEQYIQQNELCAKTDEILLAVSGGADSVALLHLFHKAGYSIALAHCNFTLRFQNPGFVFLKAIYFLINKKVA